jgi:acyl phosphate:glycerol-3-phosphate acyltransferase
MHMLVAAAAVLAAYLIGSLSFAVIVSRVMGLSDPRSYGSGNPGATNVLRSGNKAAALLTLLLDALKGFVPVLLAVLYGPRWDMGPGAQGLVGLAAFVGHLWPLFFRFQGGKGVATAAGVLFALNPLLGAATLATWIIIAFFFRYSSLASLTAAVFAPFYQMLFWDFDAAVPSMIAMSLLLVWRHSANIGKLLAGTENRIGGGRGGREAKTEVPSPHPPGHKHSHAGAHAQRKRDRARHQTSQDKGAKS